MSFYRRSVDIEIKRIVPITSDHLLKKRSFSIRSKVRFLGDLSEKKILIKISEKKILKNLPMRPEDYPIEVIRIFS